LVSSLAARGQPGILPVTMSTWTTSQWKALAIVPKVTSALSLAGSAYILTDVLSNKQKRHMVYPTLMTCLSISDAIASVGYFFSTWPIPSDTQGPMWGAVGTTGTCTAQGFFVQLGILSPLYNVALSLYYLLLIKYNWSEERLRSIQLPIHAAILTFSFGTAFACLPLTLYNVSKDG